eukprot:2635540-Rhodomonas_salina.1
MAQTQTPQTNSTVTTRKNTEADTTLRLANWHTLSVLPNPGVMNHPTVATHDCWRRTCPTPLPDRQEPQALTDMDTASPGSMAAQMTQTDLPTEDSKIQLTMDPTWPDTDSAAR